jgi:hypothetical protein
VIAKRKGVAELRKRDVNVQLAAKTAGQRSWTVATGVFASTQLCIAQCLLRIARDSKINCEANGLTRRTAGCGPACPVV